MCSIANPGEIKTVFVFAFVPRKNVIFTYLIRSNLSRDVLRIPAGGAGAASRAWWLDADGKGVGFLFPLE